MGFQQVRINIPGTGSFMIIYHNDLLKLNLQPAKRLLEVTWPHFDGYSQEDGKISATRVLNALRDYDVNYLLLDASNSHMGIELSEFHEIVSYFINELGSTKVKKVARLMTNDQNREQLISFMAEGRTDTIEFQNFSDKAGAFAWLLPEDETNQ